MIQAVRGAHDRAPMARTKRPAAQLLSGVLLHIQW